MLDGNSSQRHRSGSPFAPSSAILTNMISVEELPEPRPHHYVFAHQWLPRFAQSNSAAFFALFTTGEGQAAMVNFWDTVGESLAPKTASRVTASRSTGLALAPGPARAHRADADANLHDGGLLRRRGRRPAER